MKHHTSQNHVPLDGLHSALLPKSSPRVSQSTTEHSDRVIYSARIAMQDLLRDKCPAIYLLGDGRRDGPSPLMRYVDVPWISVVRLVGRTGEGWN